MEPRIIERGRIFLAGVSFFGDPFTSAGWTEENEIGRLWKRLESYLAQNAAQLKNVKDFKVGYEVWGTDQETASKGEFDIFAGLEIETPDDVPVELLVKFLPATQYAVFTLEGEQISSDWPRLIYQEWLPTSGYEVAYQYNFQRYDERFKGLDRMEESVIDVYVPVKQADVAD